MKTIEERAKELASKSEDLFQNTAYTYYICGATKQREIDIQRACKWLQDCLPNIEYITNAGVLKQSKQQFIESFKQVMKEE